MKSRTSISLMLCGWCGLAALIAICCVAVASTLADEAVESAAPGAGPTTAADGTPAELIAPGQPDFAYLGSRSCSSTACHGSVQPDRGGVNHNGHPQHDAYSAPIRRDEFVFWLEQDPHASAAATLFNAESEKMLKLLGALDDQGRPVAEATKYETTMRQCSACHNPTPGPHFRKDNNHASVDPQDRPYVAVAQGVGCESCHGPASEWLTAHYQRWWPTVATEDKRDQFGMSDTEGLLSRARICAKCHVGGEGMDVNHDLIAAGHPPLKFEMASYLDYLPKHWNDVRERRDIADFEMKTWLAGQIASAEAALEQLALRTSDYDAAKHPYGKPVYPEFAEYDCFACHHDLRSPSWRIDEGPDRRNPGLLSWGSWYHSLATDLLRESQPDLESPFEQLRRTMTAGVFSTPKAEVHSQAKAAAETLEKWLASSGVALSLSKPGQSQTLNVLEPEISALSASYAGPNAIKNWDVAVQVYLLLAARDKDALDSAAEPQSARSEAARKRQAALRTLREALAYPKGYDSPESFSTGGRLDNPPEPSRREVIQVQIAEIEKMLSN